MKTTILSTLAFAPVAALMSAAATLSSPTVEAGSPAGVRCAATSPPAAPGLEPVRSLVGEWVEVDEEGNPTDAVASVVRETAGGSAVVETIFPGTDHEMVTVYYVEDGALGMTHYCVLGNRPRMRARFGEDEDELVFECVAGTCPEGAHMHRGVVRRLGPDRLAGRWHQFEDGESTDTVSIELARRG